MDIRSALVVQTSPVDLASDRDFRIPDLRLLLTAHAVRQSTTPTARAIHESDMPVALMDEPSRLCMIFASEHKKASAFQQAAGSFNAPVAELMAVGNIGEGAVHSGF